ncbi:MAG: hypothetical protein WKG32_11660 [Gemmatimonadaceae bacterium]
MQRNLTLAITALCAAPLFFFPAAVLVWRLGKGAGGSDVSIAYGYLGMLAGLLAAAAGAALTFYFARRYVPAAHQRDLQIADAVVAIMWVVIWSVIAAGPTKLEYDGRRAVLDVEVRAAKPLLRGERIDAAVSVDFAGGQDVNIPHPERVREDGAAVILPWETTPITVKEWAVRVFVRGQPSWFPLSLPERPTASTEWSAWTAPAPREDYETPGGLALRYRFRLVPYGAQ